MVSRAFDFVAALVVAGFAFTAAPASAGGPCSYDQYGRAYNCHHTGYVASTYQPTCGSCGNGGLFTSAWVQPAPCGYNPCQQQVYVPPPPPPVVTCGACQQQVYAPQDDDHVPQYRSVRHVRHVHRHPRPYYHRERYIRRAY
jgi:hypothetical protein